MKIYLGTRDAKEAHRHQHPSDRDLIISKLDTVQILHTQTVRGDQTIQRKDLVHLDRSNECAPSLTNDMRN